MDGFGPDELVDDTDIQSVGPRTYRTHLGVMLRDELLDEEMPETIHRTDVSYVHVLVLYVMRNLRPFTFI